MEKDLKKGLTEFLRKMALDSEVAQELDLFSPEDRDKAITLMAYGYWNGWLDRRNTETGQLSDNKKRLEFRKDLISMTFSSLMRKEEC